MKNTIKKTGILVILITILITSLNASAQCSSCGDSSLIFYDEAGENFERGVVVIYNGKIYIPNPQTNILRATVYIPDGETCTDAEFIAIKQGQYKQIHNTVRVCNDAPTSVYLPFEFSPSASILSNILSTMSTVPQSECTGTICFCKINVQGRHYWYTETMVWDAEYGECVVFGTSNNYCGSGETCESQGSSCTCVPGSTVCDEEWVGSKWCCNSNSEICQKWRETDCGTITKTKYTCASDEVCLDARCVEDNQLICGNGVCDTGESFATCPADCEPVNLCGNGECDTGESCNTCPNDCGSCNPNPSCGNSVCDGTDNCNNCPADCGACSTTCNNDDVCVFPETLENCPNDCKLPPAPNWWEREYGGVQLQYSIIALIIIIFLLFMIYQRKK